MRSETFNAFSCQIRFEDRLRVLRAGAVPPKLLRPAALLVLTLLAFTLVTSASGHAAMLTVCASGCDYTTITDAIGAAGSGDTISVQDTVHKEAHIVVNKHLTIQGQGASKTAVDGDFSGPIFTIDDGITATIQNITIRNADGFNFQGGGIYNNGTTTIRNSIVSDNTALSAGGGIYNIGTITISNSSISDNICNGGDGGGIYSTGTVTIDKSTVSGNFADFVGGGIYSFNEGTVGTVIVTSSTLSDNTAFGVGGLFNNGTTTISNSTVSGNSSFFGGSGISDEGTSTISNSTIAGNTSSVSGAALVHSFYSSMTIKDSIIGDNSGGDCLFTESPSSVSALGANLDTDGSCGRVNFKQVSSGQLKLGPLALNSPGSTETRALLPGSVAIDAVTDCTDAAGNPVTTDQRGALRPDAGEALCDIGAYEFQDFAGRANCKGKSVSALAHRFGGLSAAASAYGFSNVKALQAAIRRSCGR